MAKTKKGKSGEAVARKAASIQKKQLKQQLKSCKKADGQNTGEDPAELEKLFKGILEKEQNRSLKDDLVAVSERDLPPEFTWLPPRGHFQIVVKDDTAYIFGGEFYDGHSCKVYSDFYCWKMKNNKWTQLDDMGKGPQSRCAHQMVLYENQILLFGGEYSTIEKFFHYKDFWSFDLKARTWQSLPTLGGPSARSGHRMAMVRSCLAVFGGFYDTYNSSRYYNDLYLFSMRERKWVVVPLHQSNPTKCPPSRSGCCFVASGSQLYLFGGYNKAYDGDKKAKGNYFNDCWQLDLSLILDNYRNDVSLSEVVKTQIGNISWVRITAKQNAPSRRTGGAATLYKKNILLFGGVVDDDRGGVTIQKSLFFNQLLTLNTVQRRWHPFLLKKGEDEKAARPDRALKTNATSGRDQLSNVTEELNEDEIDEDDIEDHYFAYVDCDGQLVRIKIDSDDSELLGHGFAAQTPSNSVPDADEDTDAEGDDTEQPERDATQKGPQYVPVGKLLDQRFKQATGLTEPKAVGVSVEGLTADPTKMTDQNQSSPSDGTEMTKKEATQSEHAMPLPRMSCGLVVSGSYLYVLGGLVEVEGKQVTLDDCWRLHLGLRKKWEIVNEGTYKSQNWLVHDSDSSSSGSDDEDDNGDEENSSGSDVEEEDNSNCGSDDDNTDAEADTQLTLSREKRDVIASTLTSLLQSVGGDLNLMIGSVMERKADYWKRTKALWISRVQAESLSPSRLEKDDVAGIYEQATIFYNKIHQSLVNLNVASRNDYNEWKQQMDEM